MKETKKIKKKERKKIPNAKITMVSAIALSIDTWNGCSALLRVIHEGRPILVDVSGAAGDDSEPVVRWGHAGRLFSRVKEGMGLIRFEGKALNKSSTDLQNVRKNARQTFLKLCRNLAGFPFISFFPSFCTKGTKEFLMVCFIYSPAISPLCLPKDAAIILGSGAT